MEESDSLIAADEATPNEETTETTENQPWYMSEGVQGEGDKPEWYKDSKYKSVADQAKAYTDLESRFGGFVGAPEGDYELSFPEGVEGEWIDGDPLMESFQTIARESNMSQEVFTQILHSYIGNESQLMGTDRESELKALGDNAQARLQNINDFAKANLSEEDYQGILAATTTAAGVKAIEALIQQTRGFQVPKDKSEVDTGLQHSEIRERMNDPRYKTDKAFRDETSRMYEKLFGTEPKRNVVG